MSTGNRGIFLGSLQVLYIHMLFIVLLSVDRMTQSGTYQHEGRMDTREITRHSGTVTNFSGQPLNNVVSTDVSPILCSKIVVSQSFFNAFLYFLVFSFSFMESSSSITNLAFS